MVDEILPFTNFKTNVALIIAREEESSVFF